MFEALTWWVIVQLVGLIALPVTFLLFSNLSDKGFPFSRPLGVLILSYVFWIGGTFHVLPNSRGSIIGLLVVFLFASLFLFSRCRDELLRFVRDNRRILLIEEGLFLIAFLIWAFIRSYNPEIRATEQPMDFGFLNGVYRSEYFPPNDPWLAGHSISYYYFGYLMMATLTKLSGLATSLGYNLSMSMLFGMIAVGAFSITYNLVAGRSDRSRRAGGVSNPSEQNGRPWLAPVSAGLMAALFVVVIGNLEGALELLRAHTVGSSEFWRWIGIKDAFQPYASLQWYPTENWWWWRATRVINSLVITVDPTGRVTNVNDSADYTITEFPFFSFLLGDMHPHVMALPFTLLAIALSLNVLGRGKEMLLDWSGIAGPRGEAVSVVGQAIGGWLRAHAWQLGISSLVLGALGFLNSWDFPTYAALFVVSAGVGIFMARGRLDRRLLATVGMLALTVGIGGIVLYLPFYIGFQSQASGVLPVLGPGTQLIHFAIIWGLFLVIVAAFVVVVGWETLSAARNKMVVSLPAKPSTPVGAGWSGGSSRWPFRWWTVLVVLAPVVVWVALAMGANSIGFVKDSSPGAFLTQRAWRIIPMLVALAAAVAVLDAWLRLRPHKTDRAEAAGEVDRAVIFVLLLAAVGFTLILGCELFYIRDVFGKRMNTVFKFYYQAWVLLALASSYGLYYVHLRLLRSGRWKSVGVVWLVVVVVGLAGAMVYPVASVASKTNNFAGPATLDGTAYVRRENPGEYQAIQWLIANVPNDAVIVEATGGEYSEFARVSTRTGLPTILGWAGHEWQWRGSDKAYVGRAEEIDTIYRSFDRGQVLSLLQKYNVAYVYAGHLERNKYGSAALDKFASFMDTAFKNETTAIYKVRR